MQWQKCSMQEAFLFAKSNNKTITPERPEGVLLPDYEADPVWFNDGTGVCCKSDYTVGGTSWTPMEDAEPPLWWIYS